MFNNSDSLNDLYSTTLTAGTPLATPSMWFRAQICLLNFVFGDQNFNLVASVTTSVIEVGDKKL
jgi:hypothetical protein